MFLRSAQLFNSLYHSPRLHVFNLLPISDDQIFSVQFRAFLLNSLWSVADLAIFAGVAAFDSLPASSPVGIAIAFGLLQWIFVVAIPVCLLAYWPDRRLLLLGNLFLPLAFFLLLFGYKFGAFVSWIGGFSFWVPPLGWILYMLRLVPARNAIEPIFAIGFSAIILGLAPLAYRNLRAGYSFSLRRFQGRQLPSAVGSGNPEMVHRLIQPTHEMEAVIQQGLFLRQPDWNSVGFLEMLFSRFFDSRQKIIAEFLLGGPPRWTKGLRFFAISVLLGLLITRFFVRAAPGQSGFFVFLILAFLLMNIVGRWRGFASPSGVGLQSPFYSLYPLGFWEIAISVIKINFLRFFSTLPILVVAIFALLHFYQLAINESVVITGKILFLAFFLQPLAVIFLVSPHTNDTGKPFIVLLAIVWILALLGSGAGIMFTSSFSKTAICSSIYALLSSTGLLFYGRLFNRGSFDLVPLVKSENTPLG